MYNIKIEKRVSGNDYLHVQGKKKERNTKQGLMRNACRLSQNDNIKQEKKKKKLTSML